MKIIASAPISLVSSSRGERPSSATVVEGWRLAKAKDGDRLLVGLVQPYYSVLSLMSYELNEHFVARLRSVCAQPDGVWHFDAGGPGRALWANAVSLTFAARAIGLPV